MKQINLTAIIVAFIIGLSVVISIWMYRDVEIKKLRVQLERQIKIDDCIKNVRQRYGKVADKGVGVLNEQQIYGMKNEMNGEEERCINKYK